MAGFSSPLETSFSLPLETPFSSSIEQNLTPKKYYFLLFLIILPSFFLPLLTLCRFLACGLGTGSKNEYSLKIHKCFRQTKTKLNYQKTKTMNNIRRNVWTSSAWLRNKKNRRKRFLTSLVGKDRSPLWLNKYICILKKLDTFCRS